MCNGYLIIPLSKKFLRASEGRNKFLLMLRWAWGYAPSFRVCRHGSSQHRKSVVK